MSLLYINWDPSPEIFSAGSFAIRWYGLLFAMAFLTGYVIMNQFFKKEGIPAGVLDKLTIYMALGTVIGARLGHCFLYEPAYFIKNPFEIVKVWHGGLASHGAAIGIVIALLLFSWKSKRSFWWVIDRIVIIVASAGFFIRMGNLMNSEIIGNPADVPWAFVFKAVDNIPRHPAQLYEALFCVVLFLVLFIAYKRKAGEIPGLLFSLFLIFLWTFRFFIEFVKEPQVPGEAGMTLNIGQLMSIPFAVVGLALLIIMLVVYKRKSAKKSNTISQ